MQVENKYQRGQVMVLLVISIVVLLGFTALAIDGGMVYADRRHAQSGADASSLAGGGAAAQYLENAFYDYDAWGCTDPQVTNARILAIAWAIQRALDNDYVIDDSISDVNGVETVCGIEDRGGWFDKYIDVHTAITRETETNFAHFIYGGPLRNEVQSVTRIRPRTTLGFGSAIIALREDCPNSVTGGVHFNGTGDVIVTDGSIYSNACIVAGGDVIVDVDETLAITCVGEGCYTENGQPNVDPVSEDGSVLDYADFIPEPEACTRPPADTVYLKSQGGGSITPGWYQSIKITNTNAELDLAPGLYCVEGDFSIQGGTVTGDGVTIFIQNGIYSVTGNPTINLSAPTYEQECDSDTGKFCPPGIKGVLLYLAKDNTGTVTLTGTTESTYTGTVYAPDGTIKAGGTGDTWTLNAQLIADTVIVEGTAELNVVFNEDLVYQIPTMLELHR